jgi:hypothetical protein
MGKLHPLVNKLERKLVNAYLLTVVYECFSTNRCVPQAVFRVAGISCLYNLIGNLACPVNRTDCNFCFCYKSIRWFRKKAIPCFD